MDTGTVFIVCYVIQIPIALYAIFAIPMRGELPTIYENMRKNGMIIMGFLPCAFFSVFVQIISLAMYMIKVKTVEAKANKAQAKFDASLGGTSNSSRSNPFGGADSLPRLLQTAATHSLPAAVNPLPRNLTKIRSVVAPVVPHPRPVTTPSPDAAESEEGLESASEGDWLSGLWGHIFVGALTVAPFLAHVYLQAPCPMKVTTGLDCPGCGGTRAAGALLSGDLRAAADLNLLVVVAPLVVGVYLVACRLWPSWAVWRVERFWLTMSVLAAWMILRNLPGLNVLQAAS